MNHVLYYSFFLPKAMIPMAFVIPLLTKVNAFSSWGLTESRIDIVNR